MKSIAPFFIVGCVRSGTTMLRNILRQHPELECPEETHFYRWSDPFGSNRYKDIYSRNKLMARHQEIDGFSKQEFLSIFESSTSRKELMDRYMQSYLKKRGNPNGRWFDKTPQNVYGLFLIKKDYPEAKFVHIYRNPLNVAASLAKGAVMPVHTLVGAVNYWNESLTLLQAFKLIHGDDVIEVKYEDFCSDPESELKKITSFLEVESSNFCFSLDEVHPSRDNYLSMFTDEQIDFVKHHCSAFMRVYGYQT